MLVRYVGNIAGCTDLLGPLTGRPDRLRPLGYTLATVTPVVVLRILQGHLGGNGNPHPLPLFEIRALWSLEVLSHVVHELATVGALDFEVPAALDALTAVNADEVVFDMVDPHGATIAY